MLVVTAMLICPLIQKWGITGAALAMVLNNVALLCLYNKVLKTIECSHKKVMTILLSLVTGVTIQTWEGSNAQTT